jgi:hypothetical protein
MLGWRLLLLLLMVIMAVVLGLLLVDLDLHLVGIALVGNLAVRSLQGTALALLLVQLVRHLEVFILQGTNITERIVVIVVLRDTGGYIGSTVGTTQHRIARINHTGV